VDSGHWTMGSGQLSIAHYPLLTVHSQLPTVHAVCMLYLWFYQPFYEATVCKKYFRFVLSGHTFCECSGQWAVIMGSGQETKGSKTMCSKQWVVDTGQ
jgi:hypothetical protein